MTTDAMDLTGIEALCLARRIVAQQAAARWLEWEDYPMLSEDAFSRLAAADAAYADHLWAQADDADTAWGIDSIALLDRAR